MTKQEKELYKELRMPNLSNVIGEKRKRESSGVEIEKGNENDQTTSNKLAKFAAII